MADPSPRQYGPSEPESADASVRSIPKIDVAAAGSAAYYSRPDRPWFQARKQEIVGHEGGSMEPIEMAGASAQRLQGTGSVTHVPRARDILPPVQAGLLQFCGQRSHESPLRAVPVRKRRLRTPRAQRVAQEGCRATLRFKLASASQSPQPSGLLRRRGPTSVCQTSSRSNAGDWTRLPSRM
jgi:hypothetical protein